METIYRTSDGKEFASIEDAERHEKHTRARERIKDAVTYTYYNDTYLDEEMFDRIFDEETTNLVCERMTSLGIS